MDPRYVFIVLPLLSFFAVCLFCPTANPPSSCFSQATQPKQVNNTNQTNINTSYNMYACVCGWCPMTSHKPRELRRGGHARDCTRHLGWNDGMTIGNPIGKSNRVIWVGSYWLWGVGGGWQFAHRAFPKCICVFLVPRIRACYF